MLHTTVTIQYTQESIDAGRHMVESTLAVIEGLSATFITCRLMDDNTADVYTDDIKSITVMDEDTHQEFTNEFLMARKNNEIKKLSRHVLAVCDSIIEFCPETRETLIEQLIDKLNL